MIGRTTASRAAAWAGGLLLLPCRAEAHLVTTGLGPTYDGVMHFVLSPEDIFPVVALSLFAGLRGPDQAKLLVFALPPAWLLAGLAGWALHLDPSPEVQQIATAVIFLTIGLILAVNLRLPGTVTALAGTVLGFARGAVEGDSFGQGPPIEALLGITAASFAIIALAASVALTLKQFWMIVALRVTGSWLAALGLLLIGWSVHTSGFEQSV